jgi:hypothetical protein
MIIIVLDIEKFMIALYHLIFVTIVITIVDVLIVKLVINLIIHANLLTL